ncbi:hypothetical protein M430DRAFT_196720 [Amorphotheca resinae ATCC 22711]|jgi:hypothetical protein|uniref:Uncharacterized protein n=1 Tax=Amorphotheca resinae ATCC 22711 TaxID=857342 RepID=A0A2T3B9F1_AMORE|nr:hypothetical protein M430DRAFT_196720 [Amorphotheca resinae ATCC 22711]PSS24951.1 hypothetical protein M430DRAFT_196720 [Amorphotheca resinae ATCC 22711]
MRPRAIKPLPMCVVAVLGCNRRLCTSGISNFVQYICSFTAAHNLNGLSFLVLID